MNSGNSFAIAAVYQVKLCSQEKMSLILKEKMASTGRGERLQLFKRFVVGSQED